ncbi:MAG TPA: hypothetical protein VN667_17110 [Burkholderiales bacterium]|nr:hypothetical protein [Burkholderiales bacterium]
MSASTLSLNADLSAFNAALRELALRLKALDPAEGLARQIRDDIEEALSIGVDELLNFGPVTAGGAGELLVQVQVGPKLQRALTTLRAVQGDNFVGHGASL